MNDLPREQLEMQGVDPLQGRHFLVCKRDGRVEDFNEARIFWLSKAHLRRIGVLPLSRLCRMRCKPTLNVALIAWWSGCWDAP